jgi:hypothetical protein
MGGGRSHPEDRRVKDKSGHEKKAAERGALTPWRPERTSQNTERK